MANTSTNPVKHPCYNPTPTQLRRLVLEYLCHQCYVNTAQAFSQDSKRISYDDESSSSGLETGYGRRPIDRDLLTDAPPIRADQATVDALSTPIGIPQERPTPYFYSDAREKSNLDDYASSVPAASSLKDADGDDVMSPPPDEHSLADHVGLITQHKSMVVAVEQTILPSDAATISLPRLPECINVDVTCKDVKESTQERAEPCQDEAMSDIVDRSLRNETIPADDAEPRDDVLYHVELRKTIREHILWGRIAKATDILNEHYPTVLNEQAPSLTTPLKSTSPDFISSPSSTSSALPRPQSTSSPFTFVEAVRTRPLTSPPQGSSSLSPHQVVYSPFPSSLSPSSRPVHSQAVVLRLGRDLAHSAQSLPNPNDRALYLKELDNVWALMAYCEPEGGSPAHILKYLQYDRRVALADQINSAILVRSGYNPRSSIEHYINIHQAWSRLPLALPP
ncbi:hypothetical protein BS47DRAFT_635767 [Hydnum rufescens UP504]|uniref:LisH domain-containing protein n=1 Tax=Hydnum rufescens UP504 TaxID=1448309 RepID=A0A9P6BAF7_9AGAM|nr:hypothetical protein BS47DRAFT_635767 [Hydnum rufescens UP504]